ncbi:MAG TPA: hypothetical protein VF743_01590 [Acidimicrobiales bacterium]
MTAPDAGWPVARLDRIARLRLLAGALPGAVLRERLVDAPLAEVWGFVGDLEASVPVFDRAVTRVRVVRRDGDRLRVHAWGRRLPRPLAYEVVLRTGWCWMASTPTVHVVGMAAEAEGDRTRFAHLEGLAAPGPRAGRAALRPLLALSRPLTARHVAHDVEGIARAVAARRAGGAGHV